VKSAFPVISLLWRLGADPTRLFAPGRKALLAPGRKALLAPGRKRCSRRAGSAGCAGQ
jgi:hypothetical protein